MPNAIDFYKGIFLHVIPVRVIPYFLQRATTATSNEHILQRVTSDFTTSNEQRVNFNE